MPTTYMVDAAMEGYEFNLTDRPVVLGGNEVRFHAAAAVVLNGRPFALADGAYPFEALSVSAAGLKVSVSRPGTLTVAGGKALVTLLQ